MDLWIRSQDKETLIKIENISIDSENYIIGNLISDDNKSICDYWRLGYYKTKERALEVLDEIQNILKPKYILDSSSIKPNGDSWEENGITFQKYNANARIEELSTDVYEMPKE